MRSLLGGIASCLRPHARAAGGSAGEGPAVPVDKAAYHVPVFGNDYVALLRVNIPSQRSAGYHIHSTHQISMSIHTYSARCGIWQKCP